MFRFIKWLFWFGWFRSLNQSLRHWLGIISLGREQDHEIGRRFELTQKLRDLEARVETLSSAFLPVVLVKAKGFLDDGKVSYEACWYIQAEKHEDTIRLFCSPMMGMREIESVTLLNGPYVITNVQISNMSAIDDGIHPAGIPFPIPPSIAKVNVGNRIAIQLARS